MPPPLRLRLARWLIGSALAWATLGFLPMPSYSLWYLHVAALETSLAASALALLALALGGGRTPRFGAGATLLALAAFVLGVLPLLAAWPLYSRYDVGWSPGEYVGAWRASSARVVRDVRLDPDAPLLADLYPGRGAGPRPFVVVVHGGSWRGGDKGGAVHLSASLAAAGYTVADVQYSLAPSAPFPRAVQDVKCLAGRLRERAGELGIDAARGAYLGRSAGGQIALVAAYSAGDPRLAPGCAVEDRPPRAVVSLYAPTDLAWGHAQPLRPDVVRGPEAIECYLGGPPSQRAAAYRLASPASWGERALPSTLLIHGSADRLVSVEHARRLTASLSGRGQPVRSLLIPLAEHGFDFRRGGVGEQLARGVIVPFLARAVSPGASRAGELSAR